MDNIQKSIDLADMLNIPVEEIKFEEIKSTTNGAVLWDVWNYDSEHRYIIEGETGQFLSSMECTKEEAIKEFDRF